MRRLSSDSAPGPGSLVGLLIGVAMGTLSITLLFLGMRAVMVIGGACADGGPFVPARPCPEGVPMAMVAAIFGLFASAGLVFVFGPRFGGRWAGLALLGWPALFLSLGWNFVEFGLQPTDAGGPAWGWLLSGAVFVTMGGLPLVVGVAAIRSAGRPAANPGNSAVRLRAAITAGSQSDVPPPADDRRKPAADPGGDLVGHLERLAELRRGGQLSDEEYAAAKARLLGRSGPGP